jgi:Virulence factor membrane-bound polymerase, C-terminal/O-Antigen ligase
MIYDSSFNELKKKRGLAPLFFIVAQIIALICATMCWLLPNLYPPWVGFQQEAMSSLAWWIVGIIVILKSPRKLEFSYTSIVLSIILFLPLLQYAFGLLVMGSTFWLSMAYMVGVVAAFWMVEIAKQNLQLLQQIEDFLWGPLLIASLISVWIQWYQWLGLSQDIGVTDYLIVSSDAGVRVGANLGQPNLLATLHCLALIALSRIYERTAAKWIVFAALLWIASGIVLTQSKIGLISYVLIGVYFGTRVTAYEKNSKFYPLVLFTAFVLLYFSLHASIMQLGRAILIEPEVSMSTRLANEIRPAIWRFLLVEGVFQKFWFGWGMAQTHHVQLTSDIIPLVLTDAKLGHSHNIFIELLIWTGFIGTFFFCGFVWLTIKPQKWKLKTIYTNSYIMAFLVLILHASVEFPLHYFLFLLPFVIFIQMLSVDATIGRVYSTNKSPIVIHKFLVIFIWFGFGIFGALLIKDCFEIESKMFHIRFELNKIGRNHDTSPPDVLFLKDWEQRFNLMRSEPKVMSVTEAQQLEKNAFGYPSANLFFRLSQIHIISDRSTEAERLMKVLCKFNSGDVCQNAYAAINRWADSVGKGRLKI